MNLLKRELAPITPEAWAQIDDEARKVLTLHLAGRKVVDFKGPLGWEAAAISTGRLSPLPSPTADVIAHSRRVQPLVELRVPFELSIADLDDATRGAEDLDLDALTAAAARIARAEDHAILNGWQEAGMSGILEASRHAPATFSAPRDIPFAVVGAKETLRRAGVDGPYALVLGPSLYDELQAAAEDGYPIRRRVEPLVDRIAWAPALDQGALVSTRGGDYELTVGQDLPIGYLGHDASKVRLYLTESFAFRVHEEKAAVAIRRA